MKNEQRIAVMDKSKIKDDKKYIGIMITGGIFLLSMMILICVWIMLQSEYEVDVKYTPNTPYPFFKIFITAILCFTLGTPLFALSIIKLIFILKVPNTLVSRNEDGSIFYFNKGINSKDYTEINVNNIIGHKDKSKDVEIYYDGGNSNNIIDLLFSFMGFITIRYRDLGQIKTIRSFVLNVGIVEEEIFEYKRKVVYSNNNNAAHMKKTYTINYNNFLVIFMSSIGFLVVGAVFIAFLIDDYKFELSYDSSYPFPILKLILYIIGFGTPGIVGLILDFRYYFKHRNLPIAPVVKAEEGYYIYFNNKYNYISFDDMIDFDIKAVKGLSPERKWIANQWVSYYVHVTLNYNTYVYKFKYKGFTKTIKFTGRR